jgi:hypothetical protein
MLKEDRGFYTHLDLYGQPAENGISRLLSPEEKQELLVNEKKRSRQITNIVYQQTIVMAT